MHSGISGRVPPAHTHRWILARLPSFGTRGDPRIYQILTLLLLLAYGAFVLRFDFDPRGACVAVTAALVTQWFFDRFVARQSFTGQSAMITGLSLALLLRASSPWWLAVASAGAIASKFVVRVGDKHVFNPSNIAIVILIGFTDAAWVSAGQWGRGAIVGAGVVLFGVHIIRRAARSDITYAFLLFYLGALVARTLWLGDPLAIPVHQLSNGSFVIFAFLMLSDPKTTPDSRLGRVIFAASVTAIALLIRYVLYEPNALLWALALTAPFGVLLDRWIPAAAFEWNRSESMPPILKPTMTRS